MDKAAITKLCWDMTAKKDTMWIKLVHTYYIIFEAWGTLVTD